MIGIVTVNWNGYEVTRNLVSQIIENDFQDFKMVIVNNSPDEADKFHGQALFKDPRIQVVHSPENIGYSGGLNLGLKALLPIPEVSHFLLLNNDIEIEKGFIRQLQIEGEDQSKIYSPLILFQNTELVQNTGGTIHIWLGGGLNVNKNVPITEIRKTQPEYLGGCILFMHRDVIETVGLFDESFGSYCEDVDYCLRSKAQGFTLEVLWDITARHFHSYSTLGNNAYKIFLLNRNQILLARKHFPPLKRAIFIAAAIIRGGIQSFFHRQFQAYFRGIAEGLQK